MKILIAEPHPTNRKRLRITLEVEGHGVIEAPDGAQALLLLERESVDAIISDILMPKMDGFRLCYEVRRSPRWRQVPFIFYPANYAAHDPSGDEKLALRLGGDVFLRRPALPAAIAAALQAALKNADRAEPSIALSSEAGVDQEYSERLVARLEAKNLELAQVNEELAESRARFEGVIISARDKIIMVDDAERIVLFNPAAEHMFGCAAATMIGQPLARLLPERFQQPDGTCLRSLSEPGAFLRRMAGAADSGEPSATGEEFPVEASVSQLEVAGRNLSTIILRDISVRQKAEAALRTSAQQLRALALRLEDVREQERTRISREIHDVLAQDLTRLKIDLVWLAKRLASPADEALRPVLAERIADAVAQTDTAITHVQRIATELRPVVLDSLGLPAAVEWQVEDFARRTGLACRATAPHDGSQLDSARATALFRILQECLTNVARHAGASTVEVQLAQTDSTVTLTVCDNGRGITSGEIADPRSIGLIGLSERAQAFGGTVRISGGSNTGTTVAVEMPVGGSAPPFPP